MTDADRIAELESELTAAKDDLNRTLDLCEGMDDYLQEHHNFVLNILRNALGLTETASVYSMAKEIRRLKRMTASVYSMAKEIRRLKRMEECR